MKTRISQAIGEYKFDLAPVALILFLPLLVNWNVFFAFGPFPKIYPFGNDFVQTYNILAASTGLLLNGELGLWLPNWGFGAPYFASPLSGVLYPLTIALSKFNNPDHILPFCRFIVYLFAAKGLTGCFFYFLMRDLKINRWGALVGAIVWGFNLRLEDIMRTAGAAHSIMWLPLLVLFAFRLLQQPRRRHIACLSLLFAMSYFANYPANFIYSVGFIALILAFALVEKHDSVAQLCGRLVRGPKSDTGRESSENKSAHTAALRTNAIAEQIHHSYFDRKKYALALLYFGVAIALAICLVSVQLLPGLEYISHYNRQGGFDLAETLIYGCTPAQTVLGYILPSIAYTERDHYVGLLSLILAFVGVISQDKRYKHKKFFVFAILITAVYSTKSAFSLPLQRFVYDYVPLFKGLTNPGRTLILNMFCVAALSGYGMDTLTGKGTVPNNVKLAVMSAVAALLTICAIIWLFPGLAPYMQSRLYRHDYTVWAIVSFLALIVLLSGFRRGRQSRIFPWLAVAIVVADLSHSTFRKEAGPRVGFAYYSKTDPGIKDARSQLTNRLNANYYHIPAPELERIGRIDSLMIQPFLCVNSTLPSYNPPYSMTGYEGSLFDTNYFFLKTRESRRVRSLLNTRFGVEFFLPRHFVVYGVEKLPRADIIERMLSPEFDPLNRNYIEEDLPHEFSALRSGRTERAVNETDRLLQIKNEARMIESRNEFVRVEIDIPRPGFLFSSEVFFPGWKASVDEEPVRIYRTNYVFRGVPVPAGKHTVTFSYQPRAFYLGLALSIMGLLSVFGILLSDRKYREGVALVLILVFCYAPLASSKHVEGFRRPFEPITPYNPQTVEGTEGKTNFQTPQLLETKIHLEEDGIYDLLMEFPPQAYQLFVDNEFTVRVFNTASESPPPENDRWEAQAILKLAKGDHSFRFLQLVPDGRMKPVYNKLVFMAGSSDRFDIVPVRIDTSMRECRIKLAPH
ncbi:YfhO family protein [Candidatus Poribacteria bacterium]|nr:YfhO family protein [Candidatus Poribacteria bacterium]